jgi:8-oxo-dGTP diphosphatase
MKDIVHKEFGGQVRTRVSGVLVEEGKMLLIKHKGLGDFGELWIPPGGGLVYGMSLEENLIREFKEETNLDVEVGEFLLMHEYKRPPLHAIELFFTVRRNGGGVKLGADPELSADHQIMTEIRFMGVEEIKKSNPAYFHRILREESDPSLIIRLKGCFIFSN